MEFWKLFNLRSKPKQHHKVIESNLNFCDPTDNTPVKSSRSNNDEVHINPISISRRSERDHEIQEEHVHVE